MCNLHTFTVNEILYQYRGGYTSSLLSDHDIHQAYSVIMIKTRLVELRTIHDNKDKDIYNNSLISDLWGAQ